MLWKAARLEFIPQLVAGSIHHRKLAALAGQQLYVGAIVRLDSGRETRSLWAVISHYAVTNFDRHKHRF